MDRKELCEGQYGATDLVKRICAGPVIGFGCGWVWIPPEKNSCPLCKGWVTTEEYYLENWHVPTLPQKDTGRRRD